MRCVKHLSYFPLPQALDANSDSVSTCLSNESLKEATKMFPKSLSFQIRIWQSQLISDTPSATLYNLKQIYINPQSIRATKASSSTNGAIFHSDPKPAVRPTVQRPTSDAIVPLSSELTQIRGKTRLAKWYAPYSVSLPPFPPSE